MLCDTARGQQGTYPLYIFYHPRGSCDLAHKTGAIDLDGINLADGYSIEALVKSATNRLLRTRHKSLGTIYPLLFSLSDLFCPSRVAPTPPTALAHPGVPTPMVLSFADGRPVLGLPIPPLPEDIRQRLIERRERLTGIEGPLPPEYAKFPEVPEVSATIPPDIQRTIDRHFGRSGDDTEGEAHRSRWRVTFVSFRPIDHAGPGSMGGRPTRRKK
jgi:hypothetical protein